VKVLSALGEDSSLVKEASCLKDRRFHAPPVRFLYPNSPNRPQGSTML
jgi:hypothetical protein